jgi:hypothetical protein
MASHIDQPVTSGVSSNSMARPGPRISAPGTPGGTRAEGRQIGKRDPPHQKTTRQGGWGTR